MKNKYKKIIALLLVITFSVSPMFALRASAFLVFDPANFGVNTITSINSVMQTPVKDFGLDAIFFALANILIERIAASTIKWINGGFQGKPAFVTNPSQYFQNLADGIAGQVIYNHPDLKFMCSPFKIQVQAALNRVYVNEPSFQCTLGQVADNWENFMDDFSQGGWDSFINVTQNSQNNPIGLYTSWQDELGQKINQKISEKSQQLDWGRGFMSFEVCGEEGRDENGVCIGRASIETPGSVIEGRLNSALDMGNSRLQVADEINEVIAALLSQLATKALNSGLRSLGGGSSASSYADELLNAQQTDKNLPNIKELEQQAIDAWNKSDAAVGNAKARGDLMESGIDTPPPDTSGVNDAAQLETP